MELQGVKITLYTMCVDRVPTKGAHGCYPTFYRSFPYIPLQSPRLLCSKRTLTLTSPFGYTNPGQTFNTSRRDSKRECSDIANYISIYRRDASPFSWWWTPRRGLAFVAGLRPIKEAYFGYSGFGGRESDGWVPGWALLRARE